MKKIRLICFLLCLVLLATPIFSACSSKEENVEENISSDASESAITLSLWLVSEKPVSAATAALISERVNAVTNAKYKTKVVLKYLTRDEYRQTLENTILAYEIAKGITDGEIPEEEIEAVPAEDETELNEYGMSVIKYPELGENQVDIIYISGEDMYLDLIAQNRLAALDSELAASAGKIAEYTSANLLAAAKQNGVTYGIPNNNAIGNYTYLLLDKSLMDATSFNAYIKNDTIDGFFHRDVYSCLSYYAKDPSVVTIANEVIGSDESAYDLCLDLLAQYWGVENDLTHSDGFSVFGHAYGENDTIDRGKIALTWENLFSDETFADRYLHLQQMKYDGYFKSAGEQKTLLRFAVGDANLLKEYNAKLPGLSEKEYEDAEYYAVPIANPVATSEDIYSNMFGVCRYSKSLSRSMQIITLLNTDASFRNLLQYGVEGVHYKMIGENLVQPTSDDYKMDLSATGNEFLAYLTADLPLDLWDNGKVQNRDSAISPLLGFDLKAVANGKAVDTELVKYLRALDRGLTAELAACKTYTGMETLVEEIARLLNPADTSKASDFTALKGFIASSVIAGDLKTLRANLTKAYSTEVIVPEDEDLLPLETPNTLYYNWALENGYLP